MNPVTMTHKPVGYVQEIESGVGLTLTVRDAPNAISGTWWMTPTEARELAKILMANADKSER